MNSAMIPLSHWGLHTVDPYYADFFRYAQRMLRDQYHADCLRGRLHKGCLLTIHCWEKYYADPSFAEFVRLKPMIEWDFFSMCDG